MLFLVNLNADGKQTPAEPSQAGSAAGALRQPAPGSTGHSAQAHVSRTCAACASALPLQNRRRNGQDRSISHSRCPPNRFEEQDGNTLGGLRLFRPISPRRRAGNRWGGRAPNCAMHPGVKPIGQLNPLSWMTSIGVLQVRLDALKPSLGHPVSGRPSATTEPARRCLPPFADRRQVPRWVWPTRQN